MSDITIVYSGGSQNTSQHDSFGGLPSATEVTENKNNIFDNVTSKQTINELVDYRCLYVFNDSSSIIHNVSQLWIDYLQEDGANIEIGLLFQNEVQRLTFSPTPTSGTFKITVQDLTSSTITWNNDPDILAGNIEDAIKTVTDCSVIASDDAYDITFKGVLGSKALSVLSVVDNNLSPATTPSASTTTVGSPINTIAPDTGNEKNAPTGIPFVAATSPGVEVGYLYPSEGFPIWIKRTVAAGSEVVEDDGFEIKIQTQGQSI